MSRWTANQYCKQFKGKVVGSIYHNRSDYLYDVMLKKSRNEFPKEVLSQLTYDSEAQKKANELHIKNQDINETFASHLLNNKVKLNSEFLSDVQLILMDPFMDLVAKLSILKEKSDQKIFLTTGGINNYSDLFKLEDSRLFIKDIVQYWEKIKLHLEENNFNGKVIFLNFPFLHHPNKDIAIRAKELSKKTLESEILDAVPIFNIPEIYLDLPNSISHFKDEIYSMYAGLINHKVNTNY